MHDTSGMDDTTDTTGTTGTGDATDETGMTGVAGVTDVTDVTDVTRAARLAGDPARRDRTAAATAGAAPRAGQGRAGQGRAGRVGRAAPVRRAGPAAIAALVPFPPLLALAVALGLAARTPAWTSAELRLDDAMRGLRTGPLTTLAHALDTAFEPHAGAVLIVAVSAGLLLARRPRTALVTFLLLAAGWGSASLVKALVARPRPPLAHQLAAELGNDSFPSGHVALAMSLAVAAAFLARRTGRLVPVAAAGVVLVVLQGMSRLYLGVHYLSDVAGAIVASVAVTGLVLRLDELAGRRSGPAPGAAGPRGQEYAGSARGG
ncbi:hypothetical protein Sru01_23300 [Sphaerisporangium rufum]|uniref:Phosphatidic acid phosphatase type 2/haloperoxidase domain-containing protein n=1 Tax=Sphaerisporangium rufum TaxID=1381558 RepID=A0A919R1K8_9ACTN|nr:phosphatase PAP2 family protein [Sphaerisporangium rufum]GII77348.1 hypothetical protein Sru01_23300 [Sphaerisporangium rufum]